MDEVRVSYHARRWYVHVASVFPNIAPLSSGAALGSLDLAARYHIVAEGLIGEKTGEKYFIKETCAIVVSLRGFGFKNRKFGVFPLGQKGPRIIFTAVAKVAA